MLMSYSVVQDSTVTPSVMDEMKKTAEYYQKQKDCIQFKSKYQDKYTHLDKLKATLSTKFPRDQSETALWGFILDIIGCSGEDKTDSILTIPKVLPPVTSPKLTSTSPLISSSLPSNLMLTTDIASVLFQSGKFPTALLGLPDPLSRQTLATNNMFLTPSLFKMQETMNLLKSPSPSKIEPSKLTNDISLIKPPKIDFGSLDPKISKDMDFLNKPKTDFTASDLSISSVKPKLGSSFNAGDLFNQMLDMSTKGRSDFSVTDLASPAKIPKTDYSSLDLSLPVKSISPERPMSTGSGSNTSQQLEASNLSAVPNRSDS